MDDLEFFTRCDRLLALLVCRHGYYLETLGELAEADLLYRQARSRAGKLKADLIVKKQIDTDNK